MKLFGLEIKRIKVERWIDWYIYGDGQMTLSFQPEAYWNRRIYEGQEIGSNFYKYQQEWSAILNDIVPDVILRNKIIAELVKHIYKDEIEIRINDTTSETTKNND